MGETATGAAREQALLEMSRAFRETRDEMRDDIDLLARELARVRGALDHLLGLPCYVPAAQAATQLCIAGQRLRRACREALREGLRFETDPPGIYRIWDGLVRVRLASGTPEGKYARFEVSLMDCLPLTAAAPARGALRITEELREELRLELAQNLARDLARKLAREGRGRSEEAL